MKNLGKSVQGYKSGRAVRAFTLVEVIVVMVILAILAALLLPSLTGYINKANEKNAVIEARSVLTAAQTLCSEHYGMSKTERSDEKLTEYLNKESTVDEIKKLAELKADASISDIKVTSRSVSGFVLDNGAFIITYNKSADEVYKITEKSS